MTMIRDRHHLHPPAPPAPPPPPIPRGACPASFHSLLLGIKFNSMEGICNNLVFALASSTFPH